MKIGIYAGTFDPIHNGHISFAQKAIQAGQLDKVVIVAEKMPYRKKPVAAWDHRQAMIERATHGLEAVDHDYPFANDLAHQHTMQDMLRVAASHYGNDAEVWFLVGSDVYEHMHQWRDLVDAQHYGGFVVALRDDHSHDWLKAQHRALEDQGLNPHYELVEMTKPHVSSSSVRAAVANHLQVETVLPDVYTYIKEHKLYLNP